MGLASTAINASTPQVSCPISTICAQELARIDSNMERHGFNTFKVVGSLLDAYTLRIQSSDGASNTLTATRILLATRRHPYRPVDDPWHDARLFDSDKILNIGELPDSLLAIGGGVIGSEYARIFASLGVPVTLINGRDRLLGFLDQEVSEARHDRAGYPAFARRLRVISIRSAR